MPESVAPDWWPLANRNAWARDSQRLFARKDQTTVIEAAQVTTDGVKMPYIIPRTVLRVNRNSFGPDPKRPKPCRVSPGMIRCALVDSETYH